MDTWSIISVIISAVFAWLGISVPKEPPKFDPSDCWSLETHRIRVGDTIFDLPPGVRISSLSKEQRKTLIRIPLSRRTRKTDRFYCQKKEHVPFEGGSYLSFLINPGLVSKYPHVIRVYTPEDTPEENRKKYHKDIFNVSDLSGLKVLKEEFLGDGYGSVVYQFGIDGKKQEIKCSFRGCKKIRLKSGSLIYEIGFDKYDLKTNMSLDNGGIVFDGDDLPTNAIPLVNFVLSLRNQAAEGQ